MSVAKTVVCLTLWFSTLGLLGASLHAQDEPARRDTPSDVQRDPPSDDNFAPRSTSRDRPRPPLMDRPYRPTGRGDENRPDRPGPPFGQGDPRRPTWQGDTAASLAARRLWFSGRDPRYLQELEKIDPEMFTLLKSDHELEQKALDLAQRWQRAPRDQRDALRKELAESVAKHFEVRQSRRELSLKRLQEELEELKTAIQRRTEVRDEIIERRVAELVGESYDLDF